MKRFKLQKLFCITAIIAGFLFVNYFTTEAFELNLEEINSGIRYNYSVLSESKKEIYRKLYDGIIEKKL